MKAHKRSVDQERAGAEKFGGRRVARSGAGWAAKNDVRTDVLSIEYKYTDKKSYSLKSLELLQGEENALLDGGRDFIFMVEMEGREWATVSREYLQRLLDGNSI